MITKFFCCFWLVVPGFAMAIDTTTQFTAGVAVNEPPPFSIANTADLNFGTIFKDPGSCITTISFNGTDSGEVAGTCASYSGSTSLGKLTLSYLASNVTISTVDVSGFVLSDGSASTIDSNYASTTGYINNLGDSYNGTTGVCTIQPGSPCYIYIGNVGFTIPEAAAIGAYSTNSSGGAAIEVTIHYL